MGWKKISGTKAYIYAGPTSKDVSIRNYRHKSFHVQLVVCRFRDAYWHFTVRVFRPVLYDYGKSGRDFFEDIFFNGTSKGIANAESSAKASAEYKAAKIVDAELARRRRSRRKSIIRKRL